MKGALAALAVSTVFFGAGVSGVAWAQKRVVIVEQFSGPGSDKFRQSVLQALEKDKSTEVVPDKRVAAVEADLGLIHVSDSYPSVARELKAAAFVGGTTTGGKKPQAKLVVLGADGSVLGNQTWSEANTNKLMAAVNRNVGARLSALLKGAGTGAPEKPAAAVAAAEKPAEKPEKGKKSSKEEKEAAPEQSEASAAEDTPGADTEASASASFRAGGDEPSRLSAEGLPTGLDIAFVLRFFSREFTYNQSLQGPQQPYKLTVAPAPGLAVDYFPIPLVGVTGAFNLVVATASRDMEGSVYKTTAYSWLVGAKGRVSLGPVHVEPAVGYGSHVFNVVPFDHDPDRIKIAGVDYRHARLGGEVRLPLSSGMALAAGAHYMHILSAGEILDGKKYFFGSALGGEAHAGVTFPLNFIKGSEGRVGLDLRRIAFAFSPEPGDTRVAGGAVDQYIGINLGFGYHVGM
jgi:hypothetical protein